MENLKQCPFCGRQVEAQATKCLWCGKYFDSGKPEITQQGFPIWPNAKKMSTIVIVALVAGLISTASSFFDNSEGAIIPYGFALLVELLCWVCITLSIRNYSRKFSFGKQIPFIAYLSASTVTMVATIAAFVVSVVARQSQGELVLTVFIIAILCAIIAAIIHIVVAVKLKKQDEVEPLKKYGKVTLIYSIILIFGSGVPVIVFAALIFYSAAVYKMFREFDQQFQLTNLKTQ